MCGRYSFTLPPDAIRELFRVMTGLNLRPRFLRALADILGTHLTVHGILSTVQSHGT